MSVRIELEKRWKLTVNGNKYLQERFVVWHPNGFQVFTTYENAREFYNELTGRK